MKRLVCYFVPFYLSFWALGRDIPGLGLGIAGAGTLVLFLLSFMLFWGRPIYLRHQGLFVGFVLLHVVLLNPFEDLRLKVDLVLKVGAAFLFLVIVVNLSDNLDRYSKMIGVLLATSTGLMLILIYLHLFVFQSQYLTGHITYNELFYLGRAGKNTLAFFMAVLFPFAYARFTHQRSAYNLFVLVVIAFSALYTISRMALFSLIAATLLFAVFGLRAARYRLQLVAVALTVFVILPVYGEVDLVRTFLILRSPATAEQVESGEIGLVNFEGQPQRIRLLRENLAGFMTSPIFGQGLYSSRRAGASESHNDYVRILREFGLLGFLWFGSIIWLSLRELRSCRLRIVREHRWLLDGQIVALMSACVMMLTINAYDTLPVWFLLAGSQIIPTAVGQRARREVRHGVAGRWSSVRAR